LTCGARRFRIGQRSFRGEISILWRERGNLFVVNRLPLEDYLAGLINSEISSSWPIESIKAQAVAARTYAMNQVEGARRAASKRPYDITGTTLDQVYDGAHQEDYRSHEAVRETRGQLLTRGGSVFPAYYHSCCGGRTERASTVWAGEAGPPVISDEWCARSPKLLWSYTIPAKKLSEELSRAGVRIGTPRSVATSALPDSPRNEMLLIEDEEGLKTVLATTARKALGYANLKSTWFEVEMKGGEVVFTGRGYGHGVGLCQWGAKAMAEAGRSYRDILKFYYPDSELVTLY
nr:SpoIID/LytB domain-containing protein [bacterium]